MTNSNPVADAAAPVTFTEDRIPAEGIGETVAELIDLYGGQLQETAEGRRRFSLPLRRGIATSGSVECTLSWLPHEGAETTVTMTCDRDVDAPRMQRLMMLVVGVIGALLFTIWPFFPHSRQIGALAWIGGAVAIAVYLLSLRKTSGGIAFDFLQRLAGRQRVTHEEESS